MPVSYVEKALVSVGFISICLNKVAGPGAFTYCIEEITL